jgi:hypothetical protein
MCLSTRPSRLLPTEQNLLDSLPTIIAALPLTRVADTELIPGYRLVAFLGRDGFGELALLGRLVRVQPKGRDCYEIGVAFATAAVFVPLHESVVELRRDR